MSLKVVQESLKEYKPTLLEKKNVVCVSSGFKIKNGVKTDIPSFIISVKSKLNLSELSIEDVIPSEINGIKTDVIEVGEIQALGTCVVTPGPACAPHGDLYDPLIGGISIGVKKFDRTQSVFYTASGTLGTVCVDVADGSLVVLTNNHVAGITHKNGWPMMTVNFSGYDFDSFTEAAVLTDAILAQPSYVDYSNVWNQMFTVKKIDGFRTNNTISDPQLIDVAVLKVDNIDKVDCSVLELTDDLGNLVDSGPFPWASPNEVTIGLKLFKSGRTTGMVNFGEITSIDSSPVVEIYAGYLVTYDQQIEVSYASLCAYSGDSGSGVYARIGGYVKLIGLLHAGNVPSGTVYYVCPIWIIADTLNLKAWNGDIILQSYCGETITRNGKTYDRLIETSILPTHLCDESSSSSNNSSSSSSPSISFSSSSSSSSSSDDSSSSSSPSISFSSSSSSSDDSSSSSSSSSDDSSSSSSSSSDNSSSSSSPSISSSHSSSSPLGSSPSTESLIGDLFAWGFNDAWQVGDGTRTTRSSPVYISDRWTKISAGPAHSHGIRSNKDLYSWGLIGAGYVHTPGLISQGWTAIYAGQDTKLGLKGNDYYAWGSNSFGNYGDNTTSSSVTPMFISSGWAKVVPGYTHTLGLKLNGDLYAWGDNQSGQLGDNTTDSSLVPVLISSGWADIEAGHYYSAGIKTNGDLYTWGYNQYGQLGDNTIIEKHVPTFISSGWASVVIRKYHSAGIKTNGDLYTWGYNQYGQLGDNTIISKHIPTFISSGWMKVTIGLDTTHALKINGDLYGWGYNYGIIGNGTVTAEVHVPTFVSSGWSDISGFEGTMLGINYTILMS